MKKILAVAHKKGLVVRKGMSGWSVTLPNGAGFHTLSDSELIKYVSAY
jgi:hypothetical protein